jgi:hypothetical protein
MAGYAKRFINGDKKGLALTGTARNALPFNRLLAVPEHCAAARELLRTSMVNWIGFSKRKRMLVYKAKKRFSFKWIMAGIIFVAVLCITFNDLYGAGLPF